MRITKINNPYTMQYRQLRERRLELQKKVKENEQAKNDRSVILELNSLNREIEEARSQMEKYNAIEMAKHNAEVSRQQGEAIAKAYEDMGKCIEIARRIANGDRVPPQDEKRLLEYSFELYSSAKNMASMKKNNDPEEYDSLWEDEEEEKTGAESTGAPGELSLGELDAGTVTGMEG